MRRGLQSERVLCTRWKWGPAIVASAFIVSGGCEPYRIEYHKIPSFYDKAAPGQIPDRVELEDGTIIVYERIDPSSRVTNDKKDAKTFEPRTELEDGTVVLQAVLPQHVVFHTVTCLREEEYELLFDQVLAEDAKMSYETEDEARVAFTGMCKRNRRDLLVFLNRVLSSFNTQDVVVETMGEGVLRVRLYPAIARGFKYKGVYIANEAGSLRLLTIK
jgi:hypothetical protein